MKRVIGGSALIGLSLFMLLSFTKAKLHHHSRTVKLVAFGVSALVVMGTGVGLIYSGYGPNRRYLNARKKELEAQTIQSEIVKLAIEHQGKLTLVEVIATLRISSAVAQQHLNLLTHQNLAEVEITDSGTLVYAFHDVQALSEKYNAKRIAEA